MTLFEYEMLSEAFAQKREYELDQIYLNAWLSREVKAQKEVGTGKNKKSEWVYQSFPNFRQGIQGKTRGHYADRQKLRDPKLLALIKRANN
ncbi:TPA: hypothetical protein ACGO1T_001017 [Streptococcus suis]